MKKRKWIGEERAFNRRISQKDSMALLKLHRISKKLPAATLAAFGRCRGCQAFILSTLLVRRLKVLMCPLLTFEIGCFNIFQFIAVLSTWRSTPKVLDYCLDLYPGGCLDNTLEFPWKIRLLRIYCSY